MDGADEGGTLLILGQAGVGKTALLGELAERAAAGGRRVLRARGSEMERDFGFAVVRKLFGPLLREASEAERQWLFEGPAEMASPVFGFGDGGFEEGAEGSLYGLYWFVAALAEKRPLVLVIDDAHWSDAASLRWVRYLAARLDGLPILLVLATRPDEPGVQAELLGGLFDEVEFPTVRPAPLSEAATAAVLGDGLGARVSDEVARAGHEATGGNPFLIAELVQELAGEGAEGEVSVDRIVAMGPKRIGAAVTDRARRLGPPAIELMRAAAVLGEGTDRRALSALSGADRERATAIVDGLVAAAIFAPGPGHAFVHPLVRAAVYEAVPGATRAELHARAAAVLTEQGADPEAVAAHLLLCEPGGVDGAGRVLERAADAAGRRGAPDSAVAYLRRALAESGESAALLTALGGFEVVVRDPAAIAHLGRAAELTSDPQKAIGIYLELADLLSVAGHWDQTGAAIEAGLARSQGLDVPGALDLEAFRAAFRGYDPAAASEYERDLPRLRALVAERPRGDSRRLRWILAALGSIRDISRAEVIELVRPATQEWGMYADGHETSTVAQAALALLLVEAFEETEAIAEALIEDGHRRGSVGSFMVGVAYRAACDSRFGHLRSAEADFGAMVEITEQNELSLMGLITMLHFCLDTVVERRALDGVAAMVEGLELPAPFSATQSGGMLLEVRAAIRADRGDRAGTIADLRGAAAIFLPLRANPRFTRWRSRLALALPDGDRVEAQALADEELELARAIDSPPAVGVALRAVGLLRGGDDGVALLRDSVATLRGTNAQLELTRSLAELGAALRRAKARVEARDLLREAVDLARRCGAERLEERIVEELRIAGAKRRARALSGADSLTPSERRVAVAAAAGATNRQIAQDLFVSLRTVETHLTKTYRKLDISSRAQLAAAIEGASDPEV